MVALAAPVPSSVASAASAGPAAAVETPSTAAPGEVVWAALAGPAEWA
ncbi:hypothetical protein H7I94_33370 [Mycobacterium szulgai]|nr:hypothetical protein [Mycobacterium szulgai]MCV7079942.1 hypothetical protein [Mycobacterium szulgai]